MKLSIILVLTMFSSILFANDPIIVTAAAPTPFARIEAKQLIGPSILIAERALSHLDRPLAPRVLPWKRAIKMLERGDIDIILTIFKNAEREKFAIFTEPYWESDSVIFIQSGQNNKYKDWNDFIGKKGVRFQGTSVGLEFDQFAKKNLNVLDVNSLENMIRMVATGRVDYGFGKRLDIRMKATQSNQIDQIAFLPTPISRIPIRFAISKKSKLTKHLTSINRKILALKASGSIETIMDEFIRAQTKPK